MKIDSDLKPRLVTFGKLNIEAKDLVKRGEFRELSNKLVEIFRAFRDTPFFSNRDELQDWSIEDVTSLEYEVLRYRLFVFQHLSYYDAFDPRRVFYTANKRNIQLFENLLVLKNSNLISKESLSKESYQALAQIAAIQSSEVNWGSNSNIERKLWLEKVWLILCHVNEKFHDDEFEYCLTTLRTLEEFVNERLSDEYPASESVENPINPPLYCLTTKATISALIGSCLSMVGELRKAEERFFDALRLYTLKARNPKDQQKRGDNSLFQFRRSAQIFLYGLNRIHFRTSNISRSKVSIIISELLLTDQPGDETSLIVIEFEKAVIQRIEAGTDRPKLTDACKALLLVKDRLLALDHKRLLAEVDFELAIVCHLLGDHTVSENYINDVAGSTYGRSHRMQANARILKSHIARKKQDYSFAVKCAREAMEIASKCGNVVVKIDAHICLAESCYAYRRAQKPLDGVVIEDARRLFESALSLNGQVRSPKVDAICFLGLSKVASMSDDQITADKYLDKFEQIKQLCQHEFVKDELLREALEARNSLNERSFVINGTDDLDFESHVDHLRKWLYRRASESSKTDDEISSKLNISRQSVVAWRKKFGHSEQSRKKLP